MVELICFRNCIPHQATKRASRTSFARQAKCLRKTDGRFQWADCANELAYTPGSVPAIRQVAAIHLGLVLPPGSSDLPDCAALTVAGASSGPPSNAICLILLRVGFAEPPLSPGALVGSYPTVSPLPSSFIHLRVLPDDGGLFSVALSRGRPRWPLATTLPCGARTFLGNLALAGSIHATAQPTRSRIQSSCRRGDFLPSRWQELSGVNV